MIARLPKGNLLVPTAESDTSQGIDSDGYREVTPSDPDFTTHLRDLERYEAAFGRRLVAQPANPEA